MQPGNRSLNKPTEYPQAAAMLRVAGGKFRLDTQPAQDSPEGFGIIPAVALQAFRLFPFGSGLAADGWHVKKGLQGLRNLIDIGRRHLRGQGDALGIRQHMVLATGFAPIRGIGAGILASFGRLGEAGIDQSAAPVDLVGAIEFRQQQRMQLDPDAGLVPGLQVMSARLAATATQFGRQVIPSNPGLQDEQDAGEDFAVVQGLSPGKPKAALRCRRQQRFNAFPQGIANQYVHGTTPRLWKKIPATEQLRACQTTQKRSLFPNALRTGTTKRTQRRIEAVQWSSETEGTNVWGRYIALKPSHGNNNRTTETAHRANL